MNLYQKCLGTIEQNAEIRRTGKFVGIPYPFERFREFCPSIDKETVTAVTSYTGAAKSKFVRNTYVMHPYEFSVHNNYPILIDYYALEDSALKVFKGIMCHYMYIKHKIRISAWDLDSKFKELSSDVRKKLKEGEKYLSDLNIKVRIKDTLTNPYGIHLDILKTAATLGEIHYEKVTIGGQSEVNKIVGFTPKDNTHWIGILDNLNNVDKNDWHKSEKEAMDDFVKKYVRLIYSKIFKMSWLIVHQQALEAERQQFTSSGGSILEKIKPSLANLGGTKEVVRSYHMVLSLFEPQRFKIDNYKGYDIKLIGNNFRELEVLKSNDGLAYIHVPLYFDGASEVFKELPHSEKHKDQLQKFYAWLQEDRLKQKNNNLLF